MASRSIHPQTGHVESASKLAGDTADERRLRRQRETWPILDHLRGWIDHHRAFFDELHQRSPSRSSGSVSAQALVSILCDLERTRKTT